MQRRKHIKATPNNIAALAMANGPIEAANSLGITPTALKAYIRHKAAPKATELAAGSLLGVVTKDNVTAVVQCDSETLSFVKRIIELCNGNVTQIKY